MFIVSTSTAEIGGLSLAGSDTKEDATITRHERSRNTSLMPVRRSTRRRQQRFTTPLTEDDDEGKEERRPKTPNVK